VQVGGFPVWVVTGVECPTIGVELVRKHELHITAVNPGWLLKGVCGGFFVDQPVVSRDLWDLEVDLIVEAGGRTQVHTMPLAFIPPILKPA
jgi:hypothetical protein